MTTLSRVAAATIAAITAALVFTGCGVGSDDAPEPVDDTSIPRPSATPSIDTGAGPTPNTATSRSSRNRPLTDVPASPDHWGSRPETVLPTPTSSRTTEPRGVDPVP